MPQGRGTVLSVSPDIRSPIIDDRGLAVITRDVDTWQCHGKHVGCHNRVKSVAER